MGYGFQHQRPNQHFGWKPNVYNKNFQNSNQIRNGSYEKPHFNGKFSRNTPMTKTQWRRYQRIKKAEQNVSNQPLQHPGPSNFVQVVQKEVRPSTYAQVVQNGKQVDDKPMAPVEDVDSNMITDSFESGFPDDSESICGVILILPAEFSQQTLSQ
ncbi:hypothetical protein SESBI_08977 [Sesbania bispinosa]|nr:hypothetical protein SESBI_08977 [Sesbania bispinosa]